MGISELSNRKIGKFTSNLTVMRSSAVIKMETKSYNPLHALQRLLAQTLESLRNSFESEVSYHQHEKSDEHTDHTIKQDKHESIR